MDSTTARASPSGSGTTARLAPTVRPWAHLTSDLLLDVSRRLDDAADFVRFHAVCTPWRDAAPSLFSSAATRPAVFSPRLLALCGGHIMQSTIDIRCVSSFEEASDGCSSQGDILLAEPPEARSTGDDRNWVASADGTASWLLVATPEPRLLHLLTGAITPLPRFPDDDEIRVPMENARGIVYGDRTVFLYRFLLEKSESTFTAAILHPGDTTWTVMKRFLEVPTGPRSDAGAVYHDGKVLVCVGEYFWSVLTPGDSGGFAGLQSKWSQSEKRMYSHNYVLESQGELLWASVLPEHDWYRGYARDNLTPPALSVTIHALEKGAGGVMRWAVRDGWSLADRILFLGSPASLSVDAHKLGMSGGCAYILLWSCVFRYGLATGKTELVKQLPRRWGSGSRAHLWIWRQPTIAPIQEIRQGLRLYPNKKQKISS